MSLDEVALTDLQAWANEQGYRSDELGLVSGRVSMLVDELRASRKVVEAARGVHARLGGVKVNGSLGDPWMNALDGALREYDRSLLNDRSEANE